MLPWLGDRLTRVAWGDWSRVGLLWFLPALASFILLSALVLRAAAARESYRWRIAVGLVVAIGWIALVAETDRIAGWHVAGKVPWGIDIAVNLLPLGLLHRWIYARRARLRTVPLFAVFMAIVVGEVLLTVCEPLKTHSPYAYRIDFAQFSVAKTPAGIAGFILLTSGILVLALRARPLRALAFLGQYSLPIYLLHLYFVPSDQKSLEWIQALIAGHATIGTIEALSYVTRIVCAVAFPVGISILGAAMIPGARYVGLVETVGLADRLACGRKWLSFRLAQWWRKA